MNLTQAIKIVGAAPGIKPSFVVVPVEMGTHIKFVPAPPKPKTKVWWVVNKYDDGQIGWIGWYAAWRKYSYFAKPETVYEQVCLREIADFCERKTREHKQNGAGERPLPAERKP